jgi:hypothetical protein
LIINARRREFRFSRLWSVRPEHWNQTAEFGPGQSPKVGFVLLICRPVEIFNAVCCPVGLLIYLFNGKPQASLPTFASACGSPLKEK